MRLETGRLTAADDPNSSATLYLGANGAALREEILNDRCR
jgi:hypothetical protein